MVEAIKTGDDNYKIVAGTQVLGYVNTETGKFTPPNLIAMVEGVGSISGALWQVLDKATVPVKTLSIEEQLA